MNVLVVNGPNLNLLGEREPEIYGRKTLRDFEREVGAHARKLRMRVRFFQSNHEGAIVDELHKQRAWADAIIINPAAFTHYSYAIRDALKAVGLPAAEVHLSDVESRAATEGAFRSISVVRDVCVHRFTGAGIGSYLQALDAFAADRAAREETPVTTRRLGTRGPRAGAIGLGCMGMSEFYEPVAERDAIATIHRALELGMTLIDTSDMYGRGENERLVGRALRDRREDAVLATKVGIVRSAGDPAYRGVDGRPEYVRAACDGSLARLGVEYLDLYYLHRADPNVPIEETLGAMAELVAAGKVRYLGVSELSAATLRRAASAVPLAALQSEYSLFTRDVETNGVLVTARELGIALVAYAPLGRGMLTGAVRSTGNLAGDDLRRRIPRFDAGNFERNLELVDALAALARERGCTPAQLALAWLLARGDDVFALPGCEHVAHVEENSRADQVRLADDTLAQLDALFPPGAAAGSRLRDLRFVNR